MKRKTLILGGTGMLGHKVIQRLSNDFDTSATVRRGSDVPRALFENVCIIPDTSAVEFDTMKRAVTESRPDVVINCIGIVKQKKEAHNAIASIAVNSLLPHRLAVLCGEIGARFITLSTDCVFSGRQGKYSEDDIPDPVDLYGRSKLLGEVDCEGALTIRTSMIGRELGNDHGLVEWFLAQQGKSIKGFKRAIFSGLTTNALADLIADLISNHPRLSGLYQVAAEPISKFDLLTLIKKIYGLSVEIAADEDFFCDRSLNGERFAKATGIKIPTWTDMISEMHKDPTPYSELRKTHAH